MDAEGIRKIFEEGLQIPETRLSPEENNRIHQMVQEMDWLQLERYSLILTFDFFRTLYKVKKEPDEDTKHTAQIIINHCKTCQACGKKFVNGTVNGKPFNRSAEQERAYEEYQAEYFDINS